MLSHPDANAFIARLIADPADTVIRSVFADWLDEQGGEANTNWARYIRLRSEATATHGVDRDLLREDAANVAPHLKARLAVPASKFAPYFVEFMDLLPPDRFTVSIGEHLGPVHHIHALGEKLSRELRVMVIAERDNLFALVTDRPLPQPQIVRMLQAVLLGGVVLFQTPAPSLNAALDRHFPPPALRTRHEAVAAPRDLTPDEEPVKVVCQRVLDEARAEQATGLEVVAQPSGYEVRFFLAGQPKKRHTFSKMVGENLVARLFELSVRSDSGVRTRPRNTSFGNGVTVELRDPVS
jgi:uncharacterized protein (TIGR02996 family)